MRHARDVVLVSDGNGKYNKCSALTETMIYDLLAVSQISRENVSPVKPSPFSDIDALLCRRRNGHRM